MDCREANLALQGLGEGGGKCVFYQVGGCWTASRRETSGIDWRYSVGPKLFEHQGEEMAAVAFSQTSPEAPGAIVDSGDSRYTASATREAGLGEETQDFSVDALEGGEEEEEGWQRVG